MRRHKDKLEEELREARNRLKQVNLDRKIEEDDIKHMIKLKTERLELEFQKREAEADRVRQTEIQQVRDTYQARTEAQLQDQLEQTKVMYAQILERLPNISAQLKGTIS